MNTFPHGFVLALVALGLGCGRATEQSDVKLVGVGSNPDDIGPTPEYYGGVVELNWVDFAGGQIPFGLLGFQYFQPVGPSIGDGVPPYAAITGLGFIMETDLPAPDALLGSWARPPEAAGACQTVYEPFSFINNLADVGPALHFKSEDGAVDATISRYPADYPPDPRNVFTYYFGAETWRPQAQYAFGAPTSDDITSMPRDVVLPSNWAFGERLTMSFAGSIPPSNATTASIPLPLAANGTDTTVQLPSNPQGVMLSWTGAVYDPLGELLSDGESATRCLRFAEGDDVPASPTDCQTLPEVGLGVEGQIYTGPWDTEGGVTFTWAPSELEDETVSISVRFLGVVDVTDETFVEGVQDIGGVKYPAGVCAEDEDVSWQFESSLVDEFDEEGNPETLIPAMQGDPFTTLVEVTCAVADTAGDDGFASFTLTEDMLADAMAYGRVHGAAGALFYVNRSTRTEIATPPVRDAYGQRRDIPPVLTVANAVQVGRFWFQDQ